jgi:para-aminobenzoate synthetase/4-amino-4-deoxychorismate lyase
MRIKASSKYFGFLYNLPDILRELREIERKLIKGEQYKVRILLGKYGGLETGASLIKKDKGVKYVAISKHKISPESVFLFHKTTNRALYDREHSYYKSLGYFDVIFLNTRNEVAEGAISNIIIEKNKVFYTPILSSGLLPGIYRGYLLRKRMIKEKIISLRGLLNAKRVFLCNSVRGMVAVELGNLVDKPEK